MDKGIVERIRGRGQDARKGSVPAAHYGYLGMLLRSALRGFLRFTRELCADSGLAFGLVPCLVAFVLSSIGMAVPSNGGLGPWNIAVMFGLAVYGISDAQGTAFSMLQWSGQTVMLIILGIYTMLYISLSRKKEGADVLEGPKKPMA